MFHYTMWNDDWVGQHAVEAGRATAWYDSSGAEPYAHGSISTSSSTGLRDG